jgi:hypothetical protein
MNYIYINGVQIIESTKTSIKNDVVILSENTANTWQEDRSSEEKLADTKQGKNAEEALFKYIKEYKDFTYISYDDIRNDNLKKHAPFDGLLYKNNKTNQFIIDSCISKILTDIENDNYGRISVETRNILRQNDVYTVEIKSTKVNDKKKTGTFKPEINDYDYEYLIRKIKYDDYFIYPHFCRDTTSNLITNFDEYCNYIGNNKLIIAKDKEELKKKIFETEYFNSSDIQVRVYVDELIGKYFLIGYILVEDIIKQQNISKFPSDKSHNALYYKTKLSSGNSLNLLFSEPRLWDMNTYKVYNLYKNYK